jgi:hypothetical protein
MSLSAAAAAELGRQAPEGVVSRMASRPVAWILFAAAGVALSAVAFLRGNYLLGPEWGVLYGAVTLALLRLFVLSLTPAKSPSPVRVAAVTALSLALGFVMAWPASVNPDVQHFIDKHSMDRAARAELAAVFAVDPAYRDLMVSTVHLKVVNVTVRGSLGTRSDLDRLRARIITECPAVGGCVLHWDVTLRDPAQRINGLDSQLFGTGGATAERCRSAGQRRGRSELLHRLVSGRRIGG